MEKKLNLLSFPNGAQSNGFIAALSSALLPCLGIGEDTPYWCNPKSGYCSKCGQCGTLSSLAKHQGMLYHALLAASGLGFTFDYPEDDDVDFHTMPGVEKGWRWEEPFIAELMDLAGLSYIRYKNQSIEQMRGLIKDAVHCGYPALAANHGQWGDPMEWTRCWNLVCGYEDQGLCFMGHGGGTTVQREGEYEDWILITGKTERKLTYRQTLESLRDELESLLLVQLNRLTNGSLTVITDNYHTCRLGTEQIAAITDDLMGVIFDKLTPFSANFIKINDYSLRVCSLSALRVLYQRYGAFYTKEEFDFMVRMIRTLYPPERYAGWLRE